MISARQLMLNESCHRSGQVQEQLIQWMHSHDSEQSMPSSEDLSGAADALLRLQKTYMLDTRLLADGQIEISSDKMAKFTSLEAMKARHESSIGASKEDGSSSRLTASDCFEIGRQAYSSEDNERTIRWMQEALERLPIDSQPIFSRADALEYIAFATYRIGNVRQALALTQELLKEMPTHARALRNIGYYEHELQTDDTAHVSAKRGDDGDDHLPTDPWTSDRPPVQPIERTDRQVYESLCRGEQFVSSRVAASLKCHYLNASDRQPHRALLRIRVEQVYDRPYAVLFHDVVTDDEIEHIKTLARPRLRRATVQNYKTGQLETVDYRISKSGWIRDSEDDRIRRLSLRMQMITDLTVQTAEELQVVNYGLGGHYEPHFDFARREEKHAFRSLGTGNRIATWLTYLSDVEAGGATVFPLLGLAVRPRKGSALFWYNLHRNGEGDLLTRHAACPVLIGSKWIANKWFHERGQEQRRPCGLKIND
jgi:prolyl 4-hydroxylase